MNKQVMSKFDIKSLLNFNPLRVACPKCKMLLSSTLDNRVRVEEGRDKAFKNRSLTKHENYEALQCPCCEVIYYDSFIENDPFLFKLERKIYDEFSVNLPDELLQHSKLLAHICSSNKPPLQKLLLSLNAAKSFVHFMSYGIHDQIIGALKLTAQRIPVRGIVSGVDKPYVINELKDVNCETDESFEIIVYDQQTPWSDYPHHKIVIIDGIMAFTGSANLTLNGLRKAAKDLETFEAVSDISKVIELNNKYFSRLWRSRLYKSHERIDVGLMDIPF